MGILFPRVIQCHPWSEVVSLADGCGHKMFGSADRINEGTALRKICGDGGGIGAAGAMRFDAADTG